MLTSIPPGDLAVVIGSTGAIGSAVVQTLERSGRFSDILAFARSTTPALDLTNESSIEACASWVARRGQARLIVIATGILHRPDATPEKRLQQLDPVVMAEHYAINTIGPAIVLKHFLRLVPNTGKSVLAFLSARLGSITDNRLGGWYSYRASKAALNQIVRTGAIELGRRHRDAVCVALHPGTVDSALSAPFAKTGLEVQAPSRAAERVVAVIDRLDCSDNGSFFDNVGNRVPW